MPHSQELLLGMTLFMTSYWPTQNCVRLGNNLSGQYKRGVGMALQIGIGNFSSAIAANVYRTQDYPRFIIGRAYLPHVWSLRGTDLL